jgi:hypothetical protein
LLLLVCSLVLASAATLGVDGGAIQGFRVDVVVEVPTTTSTMLQGDLTGASLPTP